MVFELAICVFQTEEEEREEAYQEGIYHLQGPGSRLVRSRNKRFSVCWYLTSYFSRFVLSSEIDP